jgi:hypothetical protein
LLTITNNILDLHLGMLWSTNDARVLRVCIIPFGYVNWIVECASYC